MYSAIKQLFPISSHIYSWQIQKPFANHSSTLRRKISQMDSLLMLTIGEKSHKDTIFGKAYVVVLRCEDVNTSIGIVLRQNAMITADVDKAMHCTTVQPKFYVNMIHRSIIYIRVCRTSDANEDFPFRSEDM